MHLWIIRERGASGMREMGRSEAQGALLRAERGGRTGTRTSRDSGGTDPETGN